MKAADMRLIKYTALALLTVLLTALFSGCVKDSGICGSWETTGQLESEKITLSYEFCEDGTGSRTIEGFSYDSFMYELSENDGQLHITVGSVTETLNYRLEKDVLSIELDGQYVMFFRK